MGLDASSIRGKQDHTKARDIIPVKSSSAMTLNNKSQEPPHADSVDKQLAGVDTLDQIDFRLRETIHGGCPVCRDIQRPSNFPNYVKGDPKLYDYVVRYRALFKKERFKPEDLDDDVDLRQAMIILKAKQAAKGYSFLKEDNRGASGTRSKDVVDPYEAKRELERFKLW